MQNTHLVIGDSDEEEALDKKRSELHLLPGDDCGHGGGLGGQGGGHSSEIIDLMSEGAVTKSNT